MAYWQNVWKPIFKFMNNHEKTHFETFSSIKKYGEKLENSDSDNVQALTLPGRKIYRRNGNTNFNSIMKASWCRGFWARLSSCEERWRSPLSHSIAQLPLSNIQFLRWILLQQFTAIVVSPWCQNSSEHIYLYQVLPIYPYTK